MQTAFANFPMPARQDKPRTLGLTMMIDWGLGYHQQADLVESAGHCIDFAKIAAGIARLMPREVLLRKLAHYHEHRISTSPGGLFAELAIKTGRYEDYVKEVRAVGFTGIEVSDNLLDMSREDKSTAIARAKDADLTVFGEVGKKVGQLNDSALIDDVAACLEAGADWVYLEAVELFVDGQMRTEVLAQLRQHFPAEKLLFELPVHLRISQSERHKLVKWLVKEMGTEVNLANIEWTDLYTTEIARLGFAGDLSHPAGVYRLAGFV